MRNLTVFWTDFLRSMASTSTEKISTGMSESASRRPGLSLELLFHIMFATSGSAVGQWVSDSPSNAPWPFKWLFGSTQPPPRGVGWFRGWWATRWKRQHVVLAATQGQVHLDVQPLLVGQVHLLYSAACLIKRERERLQGARGRDAHLIRYYVLGASERACCLFVMLSSDASIPIELNCGWFVNLVFFRGVWCADCDWLSVFVRDKKTSNFVMVSLKVSNFWLFELRT